MIHLLIKANGPDSPGVTAGLLNALPQSVEMREISQAVVRGHLSLSFYLGVERKQQSAILMELLIKAKELKMTMDFEVDEDVTGDYALPEPQHRLVATLLASRMKGHDFAKVAECFTKAGYNIKDISMLSTDPNRTVIELIGEGNEQNKESLRASLLSLNQQGINIAAQTDDAFRRNKRVVLLDMDSTLIKGEFIDDLATAFGVSKQVSDITASAMRGELDYRKSLEARLKLLKGMPKDLVLKVTHEAEMNDGAERLIKTLKSMGLKVGIISGGFDFLCERIKEKFQLDYAFANKLDFDEQGKLSGKMSEPIVDRHQKAMILKTVEAAEGIRRNQIIAIGDGANDLEMLNAAGLGIAFRAKPKVKEAAKVSLDFPLDSILYFLGLTDFEIRRL